MHLPRHRVFLGAIPGVWFFCVIGFGGDCFNFNAQSAEAYLAADRFQANESELGRLGALSALGYTIPCMAAGLLSEKVTRRPVVLAALAALLLVYLSTPSVTTLNQLYVMAVLRAVATAFLWAPLMAWMSDISDPAALARVFSRYNVSWSVGTLVGFGVSGLAYQNWGAANTFYLSAGAAIALLLFATLLVPRPMLAHSSLAAAADIAPVSGEHELTPPTRSDGPLWITRGLTLIGLGCAFQGMVFYLTPRLVGPEVQEGMQGLLHVSRMFGQSAGFFLFSRLAGWQWRRWPLVAFVVVAGLGMILSAQAAPMAGRSVGLGILGAGYLLIGFSYGIAFTMSTFYVLGLFRKKGLGSGIMETIVGAGGFLGPLIAGEIAYHWSIPAALYVALIPLLAVLGLAVVKKRAFSVER